MRLVLFALALLGAAPALAQQSNPPSACISIEDDARRLACYDTENGRAPSPAPQLAPTAHLLPSLPNVFHHEVEVSPPADYVIAQVVRPMGGTPYFVMTNHETWAPSGHIPRGIPHVGDHVVIQRAGVGTFVLTPDAGDPFRVNRQD